MKPALSVPAQPSLKYRARSGSDGEPWGRGCVCVICMIRARAQEIHGIKTNLGLRLTQRGVGGNDAAARFDELLAGLHRADQGILADACRDIGFLAGHRHHGCQLGNGCNGGIYGGFGSEKLFGNFVGGEAAFFQHGTFLGLPAQGCGRGG
ncbi:hypothetical protein [Sandarakinorhabdus sp.]|uniref:hypothetical protein n=1 Tax=Sandarakinorhabdus sp. TaxID=1916663 RepID=UPI003342255D